jgi:putative phosphoribosyl transferase
MTLDTIIFRDRKEAGALVAEKLMHYAGRKDIIVLALPRGGVVNGFEIARRLNCPLDILIVRKIGFPGQPELAIGAVAETGAVVLNEDVISMGRVSEEYIKQAAEKQKGEIKRRRELYRGGKGLPELEGKTVILVDDGVATGATMKAAIAALKEEKIKKLVVGLPVASVEAEASIGKMVDEMVCLQAPPGFMAVGGYYEDFTQVTDDEVVEMLKRSKNG